MVSANLLADAECFRPNELLGVSAGVAFDDVGLLKSLSVASSELPT